MITEVKDYFPPYPAATQQSSSQGNVRNWAQFLDHVLLSFLPTPLHPAPGDRRRKEHLKDYEAARHLPRPETGNLAVLWAKLRRQLKRVWERENKLVSFESFMVCVNFLWYASQINY